MRRFWTEADLAILREHYPREASWRTARRLRRPLRALYQKARELGIGKTGEYLASPDACRLRRDSSPGIPYRFPKGHVPANKGLRRPGWAPGRMSETQFRKGTRNGFAAAHHMPVGAERLVDGYLYVKVADVPNVPYTVNWKPVHVLAWERANGRPLGRQEVLRFRDGNRLNTSLENLELITRRQNMQRNTVHNLPKPLARAIQMRGALNRRLNRMERERGE